MSALFGGSNRREEGLPPVFVVALLMVTLLVFYLFLFIVLCLQRCDYLFVVASQTLWSSNDAPRTTSIVWQRRHLFLFFRSICQAIVCVGSRHLLLYFSLCTPEKKNIHCFSLFKVHYIILKKIFAFAIIIITVFDLSFSECSEPKRAAIFLPLGLVSPRCWTRMK